MKTKLVLWVVALLVLCPSASWAENSPPVASVTANPNPATPGQDITLDGSGSYDPDPLDQIVSYEWDLDFDGGFGADLSGPSITHAYPTFGDRTVALRVTDTFGASDITTIIISIHLGNHAPIAIMSIDPNPGWVGQTIQFDGTASHDPDEQQGDSIASYEWDLDYDGIQFDVDATGAAPTHSYSASVFDGLVALRVTDILGASATATDTINIYEAAQCDQDGDSYVSDACGGDDCDDSDAGVNPGVTEALYGDPICTDGLDNDCDGSADMEDNGCRQCTLPEHCDDENPCTNDDCVNFACEYGDNTEPCDDGNSCTAGDACNQGVCTGDPLDQDQDSYVSDSCGGGDCDDSDSAIHPGVIEEPYGDPVCSDGADNDCDGLVDVEDSGCVETVGKPNVIIFFTDDQGYQDLGCYGSPLIETPAIDRMANEGVRFTDFYSGGSRCTPSRAALMTGCYADRVGFGDWVLLSHDYRGLHLGEMTLAELLKTKGYATAMIGKWHLGHMLELFPTRQGFDRYFGIPYSNDMEPVPLYRNEEMIETLGTGEEQEKLTRMYTDEGIQFIHDNQDSSFFLYIAFSMPHVPLHASDDFRGTSARGLYGDVIEEIDFHVGRVLDTLESLDLDRKTLVIYTSDNGPWLWWGDLAGSSEPFQGGKETNWEGGFRVPCIMRWPGSIPAGQVNQEMTALIDLYPTLAALAGAELPSGQIFGVDITIDGKNIWPLMSGEPGATSPHEAFYYDLGAVRSGKWKLRDGMLFDLENDPHEDDDLSSQHPDKVSDLQQMLNDFSEEVLAESRPIGSASPPPQWEALSIIEAETRPRSVALNMVFLLLLPLGTVILWRIRAEKG